MAEPPEAPNDPIVVRPAIPGATPRQNALDAFGPHQKSRGLSGFKRASTAALEEPAQTIGAEQTPKTAEMPAVELGASSPAAVSVGAGKDGPTRRDAIIASVAGWVDRYQKFISAHARQLQEINIRRKAPKLSEESRDRFAGNWSEVAAQGPPPPRPPRPLSRTRAFFLNWPVTHWMFAGRRLDRVIAGGVLVLVVGIPSVWHLVRHARDTPATAPPPQPPEPKQWDEISAAWEVGQKFLAAGDWKAMAPFVRKREETERRMKAWYERFPPLPREDASLFTAEVLPRRVMLYVEAAEKTEPHVLTLLREGSIGSYAIDWEASSGWQETDWATLAPSKDLIKLRAIAKKSDYYNFGFADVQKHFGVRLTLPFSETVLYAYAARGSPIHSQLKAQLGAVPFAAGEFLVRVPLDFAAHRQVELMELLQIGWYPAVEEPRTGVGDHAP
ncbi:MAG: hypothetical protein ACR2OZ_13045 [Verrucomicrobiales bacterium]